MRSTPLARTLCLASVLLATTAFAQTPAAQASDSQTLPPADSQTPSSAQTLPPAETLPPAQTPDAQQQQAPATAPQPTQAAAPQAAAQTAPAPHAIDPIKARYNVQVMEAVLERAVKYAAGQMNRRLQAVSPDLLQLSGAARARGFRLPGYGVFFDVDVPAALRHTMGWTLRMIQQSDQNVQRALTELKQTVAEMDPKQRAQVEVALKVLETRFEPPPRPRPLGSPQNQPAGESAPAETVTASSAATPGGAPTAVNTMVPAPGPVPSESVSPPPSASASASPTVTPSASPTATTSAPESAPAPTADDLAWVQNPDLAYEMEVRDALVSAMLEYGSTLSLGPDEYLTIAARDSENVVMPGDLSETVTVLLRIKGSDLFEYKSGRLSEADARRRIEVREF